MDDAFLNTYEEWRKKRERGFILLAATPAIFLIICALLISIFAPDIPKIIRFHSYTAASIIGLAISGPRAMRKVTYSEEELLWGYSALIMMAVFFVGTFHGLYLVETGIMTTMTDFLRYAFMMMLLTSMGTTFIAYEVLDSRKTRRTIFFRLKRFSGRFWFAFMYLAGFIIMFQLFDLSFADKHALILAIMITNLAVVILTLQFRQFFEDLMNGEW
jgi:hypothetical protein